MRKLTVPLIVLCLLTVLGVGYTGIVSTSNTIEVKADVFNTELKTLDPDILPGFGLEAQGWSGPTAGILAEVAIRDIASRLGSVGELALIRLSEMGGREDGESYQGGKWAATELHGELADGPVWAVVFTDRPYLPDASPHASRFLNIAFFSPHSGELLKSFKGAMVD